MKITGVPILTLVATGMVWAQAPAPASPPVNAGLDALLWSQRAAEYKVSVMQTFRAARRSLELALADHTWTAALEQDGKYQELPPAIVLDLDETVLDNTSFRAQLLDENAAYSEERWQKWVDLERAEALPGAVEFLKFAQAHGVTAYYVTNRVCNAEATSDHTASLLRALQFPFNPQQLLCRTSATATSDKSPRRARVALTHRILLLLGDDLNDFVTIPAATGEWKARTEIRDRIAMANREAWGVRWFLLPNPVYGSWERAFESPKIKTDALRR